MTVDCFGERISSTEHIIIFIHLKASQSEMKSFKTQMQISHSVTSMITCNKYHSLSSIFYREEWNKEFSESFRNSFIFKNPCPMLSAKVQSFSPFWGFMGVFHDAAAQCCWEVTCPTFRQEILWKCHSDIFTFSVTLGYRTCDIYIYIYSVFLICSILLVNSSSL